MIRNQMLLICLSFGVLTTGFAQGLVDPCDTQNHTIFPDIGFGSRNEKCDVDPVLPMCDYYLRDNWYKLEKNVVLLNHCPSIGSCGVNYPAWMNGTLPSTADDVVHRNVCIKVNDDCCADHVQIKIKNCNSFLVYYFVHLLECSQAYCFDSNYSCDEPKPKSSVAPQLNQTVTDKPADKSNNIYMYIGIGIGVGVLIANFAGALAAVVFKNTGWYKRKRRVSSGTKQNAVIYDNPPPYEQVININIMKK